MRYLTPSQRKQAYKFYKQYQAEEQWQLRDETKTSKNIETAGYFIASGILLTFWIIGEIAR